MPSNKKFVLALDQGTSSSKAFLFDTGGRIVGRASRDFRQIYPKPGWVEHDPEEIWSSQMAAATEALAQAAVQPAQIAAVGITNQRETTVLWNRSTGKPVCNAIVWQCRRTAERCETLKREGFDRLLKARTGLVTDAYFSGTKVEWILDNIPGVRTLAGKGEVIFGTVDSWLIYNLTGGRVHCTDYSNASRTLLFDIHRRVWDEEILRKFRIPAPMLPAVFESSRVVGETDARLFGAAIPIAGNAGDQQAALFGQTCFQPGKAKNTYGTGCFMLLNTGSKAVSSEALLTTIAWGLNGGVDYALEGSVFIAGAAIQWLRDELGIISSSEESESLAASIPDTGGVYFVPAFVGLGAPYWDARARGAIVGLTRGSGSKQLARAALEAIAYQTRDVLEEMEKDSGLSLKTLAVDGGAATNNLLCQFQADMLDVEVERPEVAETTALGAAYLAGLATGFWPDINAIYQNHRIERRFKPTMPEERRKSLYGGWKSAVTQARSR